MPYNFAGLNKEKTYNFSGLEKGLDFSGLAKDRSFRIGSLEPLPEADVSPAAPKALGAIATGMQAFPISGLAGLAGGLIEPSEDRTLDIPGEADIGGRIKFDLERAGRAIEEVGRIPALIAGDKASQELVEGALTPIHMIEKAGQFYGDWVEKNWPDKDEAAFMGAFTKSIFEGTVFVGLPALKVKLVRAIKAKDMPKIKETLKRIGLEKTPEEMATAPESVFLKEEFGKRFVEEKPTLKAPEVKKPIKAKEPWEMTRDEFVKRKPLPQKGVFNPKQPPKETPGQPISAIKLDDGTIYFDTEAKIHSDMLDSLKIPPERIKEGGFIVKGEYKSGGADSARIGMQNLAKQKVAHIRAVDKALSEGKPVPAEVLKDYPDLKVKPVLGKPTANFIGYQEVPGKDPMPLYNIVGGKRHGSTVSAPTLKAEGIAIPKTPAPKVKGPMVGLKEQVYKAIDRNVFRESVSKSIQNDGQKLLDALDSNNIKEVERIATKYQKDVERDQGGGGAGPGKVKQARPGAAVLGKMANEVLGKIKAKKPVLKPPKESKVRTLRGRIVEMGKINFLNYKGEVKGMPAAVRYLSKKSGISIDNAVNQLISDGWLDKGTTVASFLEDLRTKPELLKRDRVTRDLAEKKPHELSPQEKRIKKEMAWEPEAPPEGKYIQVRAEDLPDGAELTIIEGKSSEGWDRYKISSKDPFDIKLIDGETIKLKPNDLVEVMQPKKPPTKQPTLIEPKAKLLGEPEKVGPKPKLVKPEKLRATDLVSRKESAELKQDGIWAPKQKPLLPGVKVKKGTTLYAGIPIHKAGEIYTKKIGEPIWDKLVMKKIPELLEKIPGGKAINRAALYDYRGDLKDTAKYMSSFEDMKRGQAIGREYGIDLGKRLQSIPEESQLKMGEAIRGEDVKLTKTEATLADEAMWAMLDLGKQAVDAGLLSEEAFFKNAGRYMPRLYTSKEYQSLLTTFGLKKATRLDLSRFKKRKDIPKEVRREMGEILTPGYPIAKGISQLTHDIEMARFFKGISQNKEWAVAKQPKLTKEGKPSVYKRTTYDPLTGKPKETFGVRKEYAGPIPDGFKKLPSNKRLGDLSEAYVHPEIFADLQEAIRIMETPEKVWRKALGAWKFGKVIISPKTHVRNLMSNSVLAHLGGLPLYEQPVYLTKAAKEMRKQGKYWKMIRKEGGGEHTFTVGELGILFDQVEVRMAGIKAGSLPEKFGIIGNAWGKSKKVMRKAADLYQAEEMWFKTAKFIHNIERKKMNPKQAWADAEKWLFNYAKVTKFQEKYRSKWYGAPFATFTFKSLPRMAEAMIKTPWRFAAPAAMIYALEKAAQLKIGDTKEELEAKKALRPEWQQGTMLGVPNFARVPFIDEQGREYWLNLTYILPWGDIGEAGKFGPIPGGLMPFSQPFIKEPMQQILNYDSFWKKEIVPETELAGKTKIGKLTTEAKLRGKHIAQTLLPTPVFDVTKIIDAIRNKPDYKGRFRPVKIAAADVIGGIKMYPVDYVEQTMRQISKIDPNTGYLARQIYGQIKTLAIKKQALDKKGADTSFYDKQIQEKIKQLKGLAGETKEIGRLYKQTGIK